MTYLTSGTIDQTNAVHAQAEAIVKRAAAEHVVQQGREDALLNIVVDALTPPAEEVEPVPVPETPTAVPDAPAEVKADAPEETAPAATEEEAEYIAKMNAANIPDNPATSQPSAADLDATVADQAAADATSTAAVESEAQ